MRQISSSILFLCLLVLPLAAQEEALHDGLKILEPGYIQVVETPGFPYFDFNFGY